MAGMGFAGARVEGRVELVDVASGSSMVVRPASFMILEGVLGSRRLCFDYRSDCDPNAPKVCCASLTALVVMLDSSCLRLTPLNSSVPRLSGGSL